MAEQEVGNLAVRISMDSTGFQNGISGINNQLKVVQSEFKAASAELGGFGNSSDQLKLKANSLSQQIDLQKQKVQALEQAFQASADKKGLDAKATQDLQIKLNNTRAALAGMETELGKTNRLLNEGAQKQSLLGLAVEKTGINVQSLRTAFGAVGAAAGAYLTSAFGAAQKAEASTERLTKLLENQGESAVNAGKDVKSFTAEITKMSSYSGGEAKEALQTLSEKGIEVSKALEMEGLLADVAAGRNMSLKEAADMVADAYNGRTRALVTLGILSKEEVKQLGNSETAAISMADVQQRLNERFGGSAQSELNTYSGQMKQMENQMNAAKTAIGTALLPIMTDLAKSMAEVVIPVTDFIRKNPQFTAAILAITAALGTLVGGAAIVNTLSVAFATLTPIAGALGISIGSIALPVLAVVAALGLLIYAAYEIYQNWGPIADFFQGLWTKVTAFFQTAWIDIQTTVTSVVKAIGSFIQTNFGEQINAIKVILADMFIIFQQGWEIIKDVVLGIVLLFIDLITGNFTKLKTDAEGILNNLKNSFSSIFTSIKNIVTELITLMKDNTLLVFNALKEGIGTIISDVKNTFINGITGALDWIKTLPSQMYSWGVDMIQGFINGIKSMLSSVSSAANSVADTIRGVLHFSVPDQGPLADYETWMPDFMSGLAEGIKRSKYRVTDAVNGLAMDINTGFNGSGKAGLVNVPGPSITVINQGTIVGSNGMEEFANIVSRKIAGQYSLTSGGSW